MSDTPESVREIAAELKDQVEIYSTECNAIAMLERYADLLQRSAAKDARIAELEKELTVTDDRERTHSAGCWKWHRHHACAIRRVEELEEKARLLERRGYL